MISFGFQELPAGESGTFLAQEQIILRMAGAPDLPVMSVKDIALRGDHNILNVLAAVRSPPLLVCR